MTNTMLLPNEHGTREVLLPSQGDSPQVPEGGKILPKVSIIIDNYNYAAFLPLAIDSALAQTYRDVEVVVVDDGSTDDSRNVLNHYESRIKIVLKENGGQASAFNTGFTHSTGELIAFLDSDDLLIPNAIETVVATWNESFSKLHFPLTILSPDGTATELTMPRCKLAEGLVANTILEQGSYMTSPTSGNVYSRAFLARILPMPETGWEQGNDSYLNTYAAFDGEIGAVHQPLGYYRVHGQSMSAIVTEHAISIVQIKKMIGHQIRQKQLVEMIAKERNLAVRPDRLLVHRSYLKLQLALFRLSAADRQTPFALFTAGWNMIISSLRSTELPLVRKAQLVTWAVAVMSLPKALATKVIRVGFEIAPQSKVLTALRRA